MRKLVIATLIFLGSCDQGSPLDARVNAVVTTPAPAGADDLGPILQHWSYVATEDPIRDIKKRAACLSSQSLKTTLCVEEWSNDRALVTISAPGDGFTCTDAEPCSLGVRVDQRRFQSLLLFPRRDVPDQVYDVDGADDFIRGLVGGHRLQVETLLNSEKGIEVYDITGFDLAKLDAAAPPSDPPDNNVNSSADGGGLDR